MAESPDWKERLADARQRVVFEPTPSGATPHVTRLDRLAEVLDTVEVVAATAAPDSPSQVIGRAVALLLRESINARMYAENMRARMDTQPDRVDRLCDLVDALITSPKVRGNG